MQKTIRSLRAIFNLLTVVVMIFASSIMVAQDHETSHLKDFKIVVENTTNGVKMKSDKGTAWTDLSFNLHKNQPQAINAYGMTNLAHVASSENPNVADFLFIITKTNNGINLKGIKGTSWTDLSFSQVESGKQTIDQNGMQE